LDLYMTTAPPRFPTRGKLGYDCKEDNGAVNFFSTKQLAPRKETRGSIETIGKRNDIKNMPFRSLAFYVRFIGNKSMRKVLF